MFIYMGRVFVSVCLSVVSYCLIFVSMVFYICASIRVSKLKGV